MTSIDSLPTSVGVGHKPLLLDEILAGGYGLIWAAVLLFLMDHGPGLVSVDQLLGHPWDTCDPLPAARASCSR